MNLSIRPRSAFYLLGNSTLFYLHLRRFTLWIPPTLMTYHRDTSILWTLIGDRSRENATERPFVNPSRLHVSITFLIHSADLPAACHGMIPAHLIVVARQMGSQ